MPDPSHPLPTDAVTDQDVDTAGTEADEERAARHGERHPAATDVAQTGDGDHAARSPVDPASMHRAEDDDAAQSGSRDFSEQADRATRQPPSRTGH